MSDSTSFLVANVVDFIHESNRESVSQSLGLFSPTARLPKRNKSPQVQCRAVPHVLRFRNNLSMFVTASRALFSPAAAKRSPGPISDYHPCSHALDVFSARWLTTHMYEKSSARFRELAAGHGRGFIYLANTFLFFLVWFGNMSLLFPQHVLIPLLLLSLPRVRFPQFLH